MNKKGFFAYVFLLIIGIVFTAILIMGIAEIKIKGVSRREQVKDFCSINNMKYYYYEERYHCVDTVQGYIYEVIAVCESTGLVTIDCDVMFITQDYYYVEETITEIVI